MIVSSLISNFRLAREKRSRYLKQVAEIEAMSERDLADFNGNRAEMLAHAWREAYGA